MWICCQAHDPFHETASQDRSSPPEGSWSGGFRLESSRQSSWPAHPFWRNGRYVSGYRKSLWALSSIAQKSVDVQSKGFYPEKGYRIHPARVDRLRQIDSVHTGVLPASAVPTIPWLRSTRSLSPPICLWFLWHRLRNRPSSCPCSMLNNRYNRIPRQVTGAGTPKSPAQRVSEICKGRLSLFRWGDVFQDRFASGTRIKYLWSRFFHHQHWRMLPSST